MSKPFIVSPDGNGFKIEIIGRRSLGFHANAVNAQEIEDVLNEGVAKLHYTRLMERVTEALDKVRDKIHPVEPVHSNIEKIEMLADEVLMWRAEDYNRQQNG